MSKTILISELINNIVSDEYIKSFNDVFDNMSYNTLIETLTFCPALKRLWVAVKVVEGRRLLLAKNKEAFNEYINSFNSVEKLVDDCLWLK